MCMPCALFGNPYTDAMTSIATVVPLHEPGHQLRRARGEFVKSLFEADGRSARYVAGRIGISNSALSDRLKGKAPFLADELELIAVVLKVDPVDFYRDYRAVGPEGLEPPASSVKSGRFAELIIGPWPTAAEREERGA